MFDFYSNGSRNKSLVANMLGAKENVSTSILPSQLYDGIYGSGTLRSVGQFANLWA